MSESNTGSCLCGAVRLKTSGKLRNVAACHCGQCRRQTGHYWAATNVKEDELEIEGAENLTWFASSPNVRRGFCKICGSLMFWKLEGLEHISIGAGMFDAPTGLVLDQHIYCADKGDYYEIDDGLPQYPESSPEIVTVS